MFWVEKQISTDPKQKITKQPYQFPKAAQLRLLEVV